MYWDEICKLLYILGASKEALIEGMVINRSDLEASPMLNQDTTPSAVSPVLHGTPARTKYLTTPIEVRKI